MRPVSVLGQKATDFAVQIVWLYRHVRRLDGSILASQILRSGTSIGANIAEAKFAQSRKDFISKCGIALKEASETFYWLNVLFASGMVTKGARYGTLCDDCAELIDGLVAAIDAARNTPDEPGEGTGG